MANPDPSPATRFQPGNPGGGKTSEQKRLEYEASEMAARIRHRILSVITDKMKGTAENEKLSDDAVLSFLTPDALRLFKDSEDRAHGTPRQSIEHAGPGGGPVEFTEIRRVVVKPGADGT